MPTLPLSPPVQQQHQQALPLGAGGFGSPQAMMMGGQLLQALGLLIALAHQNLRPTAAVEQQRLEQQQQQQQQQTVGGAAGLEEIGTSNFRRAPPTLRVLIVSHRPQTFHPHAPAQGLHGTIQLHRHRLQLVLVEQLSIETRLGRSLAAAPYSTCPASGEQHERFPTTPSSPAISARPSFKTRISTPKLGRPFRISLSTVLGREGREGLSTRGLATDVEEVPPPVLPLPASLVASTTQAQPPTHTGTVIDTRPLTALSGYEAGDDEERKKRERPHSWLAEVRGW
ncbi:hypothetical protein M407DRAFT_29639 [Tulasnella calospora MUT 4182]|uniref:Uncharacterized protein n=1 Tax=Tulasnella calospora MUT 4182 TaxID=1051891 RepID=A0A0C3PZ73_9AGAM|nr:hypothetical protein M407DRAFT_29639 [Tulasnella calospora MUT 4182]